MYTLAEILPAQGTWHEEEYLWLSSRTNRLIEFTDGYVEVLPMPTDEHQRIVLFLYRVLYAFLKSYTTGIILTAPLRLRLEGGKFREPDLLLLMSADDPRRHNQYWEGADLVIEVVSPDDPNRDIVEKRREYAESGIPEYWIINPKSSTITVLQLAGDTYEEYGVFNRGDVMASPMLSAFHIAVDDVLNAEA